jgi:16S rRNA processing protein RimM
MLGVITGAHGVRGEVKVKTFTADPRAIARYGTLSDAAGTRSFALKPRGSARGLVIAAIEGVGTRDAAEALKGVELFVARDRLPRPRRGETYIADLVGLAAVGPDGAAIGRVARVLNYGAGDVLEIERPGAEALLLPFAAPMVGEVEPERGRVFVSPPTEVEARGEDDDAQDAVAGDAAGARAP